MHKLVVATHNTDKLKEIKSLLTELGVQLIASCDIIPDFEVHEDKDTILGNAAKKALMTARELNLPTIADDTGLFINALDGAPGVFAARFAGVGCSDSDNVKKVLKMLQYADDRSADFKTVIILAEPVGVVSYSEGIVSGNITVVPRGSEGFGYDPIFEVSGLSKTYAEMNISEKNDCSHRARAIRQFIPFLINYFQTRK